MRGVTDIICDNAFVQMSKNSCIKHEYFVDLCTYIVQNVSNNVQTQRNSHICLR